MKKNAIMIADTRPWLIGHILLQLRQTNQGVFDEALIYYSEMDEKEKSLLSKLMPCRFVSYRSPLSEESRQLERFQLFSDLMFARYEMFRYLEEFETVTWIDTDVLIQKSLAPVLEMARENGMAANFEDPENCSAQHPDKIYSCFITPPEGYDCDRYNMSSGLICVSDTLPMRETYTKWLYDATEKYAPILSLPDQGILNLFIQRFCLKPACVGGTYCAYPYYQRDTSEEAVIHAWGGRKFWNNWYVYNRYPEWRDYYEKWLALGGKGMPRDPAPLISVVIPCYRPDTAYFRECLDSLLKGQVDQHGFAFDNFEVIVVIEPAGYEETQALIESYHDPRLIFHVNPERYGIAKSLNQGLRMARGAYIARMDDDDIASPHRFFRQASYLNEHPEIVLCTSDFEYFGDMNEYRVTFEGEMSKAWSIFTCPFDHPTIMFRRKFFVENNLFYDETRGYVEDWELWLRAFRAGMTVGCVHEGLFFHRWHNGSAGQNNQTVEMMRQLVQKNFAELGVSLREEELPLIAPWNGRLIAQEEYARLEEIFAKALKNNRKRKRYDPDALAEAFRLRLAEARDGRIPGIVLPSTGTMRETPPPAQPQMETEPRAAEIPQPPVEPKQPSLLRRILKKILKPLYAPFRNRYETPLWEARGFASGTWEHTARLLQMTESLQREAEENRQRLHDMDEFLRRQLEEMALLVHQQEMRFDLLEDGQRQQMETIRVFMQQLESEQTEANRILTQEQTEILLTSCREQIDRLYTVLTEQFNETRQQISANNYIEAENTRGYTENRIWKAEQVIVQKQDQILDEMHRHIDFTYRDILVALQEQKAFLPESDIVLQTDYPVAYESLDHLYPHGTIRDNTRYPRFVEKCEMLLKPKVNLAFLDLGCSGGGMVLEAALRGHISIGLEGSDCSKKEQRAEWRLLGDRLQTCDITKPFLLRNAENKIQQFDIITAWEVLEHIAEDDLPQLFKNISIHLTETGYFIASIADWDDIDPESGVNWHVTVHPYQWWVQKFSEAGFTICTSNFDVIDLARGGYNPPHCYEKPYPDIDLAKSLYIAVHK